MSDITTEGMAKMREVLNDCDPEVSIEDIIFRKSDGSWVTFIATGDSRVLVIQVDYCPFCGDQILNRAVHSH